MAVAVLLLWAGGTAALRALRHDTSAVAPAFPVVTFVLYAPRARSVAIAGDFNDWNPQSTALRPTNLGSAWVAQVPVPPGRYRYAFLVDGTRWIADPVAPLAPADDFGTASSVLTVGS
jgi:1,4-alpha-glucan branching enzyme